MGTGATRAVSAAAWIPAVLLALPPVAVAASAEPAPVAAVILADAGPGFRVTEDAPGRGGSHTRTFVGADGASIAITGFVVSRPPGVEVLFDAQVAALAGLESVADPSFDMASWLVEPGTAPGDGGVAALLVASRDHLFTIVLVGPTELDGLALVRELAHRQVDAAGGPPPASTAPARAVDDAELLALLPDAPPPGHGLATAPITLSGADELESGGVAVPEVERFLNEHTRHVVRLWGSLDLVGAVDVTEYPYAIFAAAGVGFFSGRDAPSLPVADLPRDAVAFREPDAQQVGVAFRRGHFLYLVYAGWANGGDEASATALAADLAREVADRAPPGDTAPYAFPSQPSRLAGLVVTALVVVGAVAGTRSVAWWRARRVRRRWALLELAPAPFTPGTPETELVDLDADAAALRRRGRVVAVVQLLTVVIGVTALAGDFATSGMVVAAASLLAGLGFSRWWAGRELGLLGPAAPARPFVLPRWPGALGFLVAFAVLGVGVAYLLKGLRYLTFRPTVAQFRWAERFGVAPRTVGVIFVAAGLAATLLGAVVYRLARASARAGVRRVLMADHRPPALYLRSFDDDSVPLPTIASARRPLFELFSLRGADPFEEAVAWELDTYAPVVAVGRPGGTLRSLGAAREHLAQDTWRTEIASRMEHAGLIVLAPGETAGLAWELAEIVRGGHVPKTLFVFPPLAPIDLARRWEHTAALLRSAGSPVGTLTAPAARVHTVELGPDGRLRATVAGTRDEATYRTAVDRAVVSRTSSRLPDPPVAAGAVGGA